MRGTPDSLLDTRTLRKFYTNSRFSYYDIKLIAFSVINLLNFRPCLAGLWPNRIG